MTKEHTFDVVSNLNMQEVRNAVQMAQKEIGTRFDFRGSRAQIIFDEAGPLLHTAADHEAQLKSVVELLELKLAKRRVSLKALVWEDPKTLPGGGLKRQARLQQGLTSEKARAVVQAIKALNLKVQSRIDGDAVRISARQIDDLQAVVRALASRDFGIPIQCENYR